MKKENKELVSKLIVVAIPIMLQNLVQSGLGFLDTLMIGQLGEAEVAAIGGANQFYLFLQMAFFGLNSGGSIFLAQYFGAKNFEGIRKVTTFTTTISIIIGTLGWVFVSFFPSSFMSLFSQYEKVIETGVLYLRTLGISYIFAQPMFPIAAIDLSFSNKERTAAEVESVASSINVSGKLFCKNVLHCANA